MESGQSSHCSGQLTWPGPFYGNSKSQIHLQVPAPAAAAAAAAAPFTKNSQQVGRKKRNPFGGIVKTQLAAVKLKFKLKLKSKSKCSTIGSQGSGKLSRVATIAAATLPLCYSATIVTRVELELDLGWKVGGDFHPLSACPARKLQHIQQSSTSKASI